MERAPDGNVDLKWNPNYTKLSNEILFVMNSDYDSSGTTYAGFNVFLDASIMDILYVWWPVLDSGHTFFESEPCTLAVFPHYVRDFSALPNGTETILEWHYTGAETVNHYDVYCDTISPPSILLAQVAFPNTRYTHSSVVEGQT